MPRYTNEFKKKKRTLENPQSGELAAPWWRWRWMSLSDTEKENNGTGRWLAM